MALDTHFAEIHDLIERLIVVSAPCRSFARLQPERWWRSHCWPFTWA